MSTLERWRADAPPEFEFVLKAWQLITHDAKSPTYRRMKKNLSDAERKEAGYFRPTTMVNDAWETTLASARALRASTILFQCPASFKQTGENIANLECFFSSVKRTIDVGRKTEPLRFAWEPRGDWDPKVVKGICNELGLWHAVDPFTAASVTPERQYFRLHGRNGWRYEYETEELRELAVTARNAISERRDAATEIVVSRKGKTPTTSPSYVFFNNVRMTEDALNFQTILAEG